MKVRQINETEYLLVEDKKAYWVICEKPNPTIDDLLKCKSKTPHVYVEGTMYVKDYDGSNKEVKLDAHEIYIDDMELLESNAHIISQYSDRDSEIVILIDSPRDDTGYPVSGQTGIWLSKELIKLLAYTNTTIGYDIYH